MTFSFSPFDIYANLTPGALLLGVIGYTLWRLGVVIPPVTAYDTLIGLVVFLGLSYLGSLLLHPLGALAIRQVRTPDWERAVQQQLVQDFPSLSNTVVSHVDPRLVPSALRVFQPSIANDVRRLQAIAIMLRNCVIPLAVAALAAWAEIFLAFHIELATAAFIFFGTAAYSSIHASQERSELAVRLSLQTIPWSSEFVESLTNLQHTDEHRPAPLRRIW